MKPILTLLVAIVLSLSLAACATTGSTGATKVKCPACGYEFTTPTE